VFDAARMHARIAAADPDRSAARAVSLARRAIAEGRRGATLIAQDVHFAGIRERPEFVELLWDVADVPAAAKP
jgi:hypothetical protein